MQRQHAPHSQPFPFQRANQVNRPIRVRAIGGGFLVSTMLLLGAGQAFGQGSGGGGACDIGGPPPGVCEDCDSNGIRDECELKEDDGLLGQYFTSASDQDRFTERLLIRTDPEVGFEWGDDSPAFGIPSDNFAVRWTGTIEAPASGLLEVSTVSDDGVRLCSAR